MRLPIKALAILKIASITTCCIAPIWTQPSTGQTPLEPEPRSSSSAVLGGTITPSKNPFDVKTRGRSVRRVIEDPPSQRFIIRSEDDLTIEVSRFDQPLSPPAPFFDDGRDKNAGLRFFRLKAD